MASTAVEVFTHVFSCCLSRRGSRRDLLVRSSFSFRFIRFWPLHFMVTPTFSSFPDTGRYFPSNFRASFVGTRARGLDIDLTCSSFIISSTHLRRLLLSEADTHPAFQPFAVQNFLRITSNALQSYSIPFYVQPLPLLLPPRSNSFVRISPKHVSDTLFPL